jgi:hypothetical protein
MGAGYFVIAIMGCADGGSACTPVATLPTHYATEAQCAGASVSALEANTQFDFPTLVARCRSASSAAAEAEPERSAATPSRRG